MFTMSADPALTNLKLSRKLQASPKRHPQSGTSRAVAVCSVSSTESNERSWRTFLGDDASGVGDHSRSARGWSCHRHCLEHVVLSSWRAFYSEFLASLHDYALQCWSDGTESKMCCVVPDLSRHFFCAGHYPGDHVPTPQHLPC